VRPVRRCLTTTRATTTIAARAIAMYTHSHEKVEVPVTETAPEGAEVCDWASGALSVTFSSKEYESPPPSLLAGMVQVSTAPPSAPLPELTAHCVAFS
jgi:hypothetical protein